MGGGGPTPVRPKRLRSSQPECLRYCVGGMARTLGGLVIGLVFTASGVFGVVAIVSQLLNSADADYWGRGLGFLGSLLFVGVGCLSWYIGFCTPEWMSFDRSQGVVTKQIGVLYFRRMTRVSLLDYSEISIFPISNDWKRLTLPSDFEVALTGPNERRFPLGQVTLSYDLAREFGEEVATFLGLPLL